MFRIFKKLLISLAAVLFFVTTADVLIDLAQAAPPIVPPMQIWGTGEDQGFGVPGAPFRMNVHWFWEPNPGGNYYDEPVNEDGYRGRLFTKEKTAKFRIVTLGDSSTMGYQVKEAVSWPRRLEAALRARGVDAEVVNFGCVGFTIFQGFELYKGRVAGYNPDIVCISFGAINEHFVPAEGIPDFRKKEILASAKYNIYNFLSRFRAFRWTERTLGMTERLHRSTISTSSAPAARPNMRVAPAEMLNILKEWTALARSQNRKMFFVSPPRSREYEAGAPIILQFTKMIEAAARELDVPMADIYKFFRQREESAGGQPPWLLDAIHPTPDGHEAYAARVADAMIAAGYFK